MAIFSNKLITKPVLLICISIILLVLGTGYYTTLTTLLLYSNHYSVDKIGYVITAFFSGLFIGSLVAKKIIQQQGLLLSYAVSISVLVVVVLIQASYDDFLVWLVARFIVGFVASVAVITLESHLILYADLSVRSRVLSFYAFIYYTAQSFSQLFLKYDSNIYLFKFILIFALCVLSIAPIMVLCHKFKLDNYLHGNSDKYSNSQDNRLNYKSDVLHTGKLVLNNLSVLAAVLAGVYFSVIYTLLPIYLNKLNLTESQIGLFFTSVLLSGSFFIYPIGYLADKYNKKNLMIFLSSGIIVFSSIVLFINNILLLFTIILLLVALAYGFYPVAIAYAMEQINKSQIVAASAKTYVYFFVGTIIGPLFTSQLISIYSINAIFYCLILFSIIYTLYSIYNTFGSSKYTSSIKHQM